MSSRADAAHVASNFTLDPETGAILMTWAPDVSYQPHKGGWNQVRVVGFGSAGTRKAMRLSHPPIDRHTQISRHSTIYWKSHVSQLHPKGLCYHTLISSSQARVQLHPGHTPQSLGLQRRTQPQVPTTGFRTYLTPLIFRAMKVPVLLPGHQQPCAR